jgi:hypothetical protein
MNDGWTCQQQPNRCRGSRFASCRMANAAVTQRATLTRMKNSMYGIATSSTSSGSSRVRSVFCDSSSHSHVKFLRGADIIRSTSKASCKRSIDLAAHYLPTRDFRSALTMMNIHRFINLVLAACHRAAQGHPFAWTNRLTNVYAWTSASSRNRSAARK